MKRNPFLAVALVALAVVGAHLYYQRQPQPQPPPPTTAKKPPPPSKPTPLPKRWPNCRALLPDSVTYQGERSPQLGGLVSPDGKVQAIALPATISWPRNIAAKGLGCCGMRALDYAARWQNVPALVELPERIRDGGQPGGCWPERVDALMAQYGKGVGYWNDTSGSLELIEAAVKSQRMACIDYGGFDPHYKEPIAHCVNVVACDLDLGWVAILDNNFPSTDQIVWMGVGEFRRRWHGWCYGLLAMTPGHIVQETKADGESQSVDLTGAVSFGLLRPTPLSRGLSVLDGLPSTVEDIILAIGPEMVPKERPHIEVDHTVDIRGFVDQMAPFALLVVAVYLVNVLTRRD